MPELAQHGENWWLISKVTIQSSMEDRDPTERITACAMYMHVN